MSHKNDWSLLPHNVLVHLFSSMRKEDAIVSSSCCIHWRRAIYRLSYIWKRLNIDAAHFQPDDVIFCPAIYQCQSVSLTFDPSEIDQLHTVQLLLMYLRYNRKLRALSLKPRGINLDWNSSYFRCYEDGNNEQLTIKSLCDALCGLIQNCPKLEHLSLGLNNGFIGWQNHVLVNLREYQMKNLKSLHIPYLRSNFDDDNSIPFIGCSLLTSFNLTHLSFNCDHISEELLFRLTRQEDPGKLQSLTLFVNDNSDFPEIRNPVWRHVTNCCPQLKVTLNLVHASDASNRLKEMLCPALPLAHLRLYFCGGLNRHTIRLISEQYPDCFLGLHVVDCFNPETGEPYYYHEMEHDYDEWMEPDPMVILAWKCVNLREIIFVGQWISAINVIGISALRGDTLRRLEVPECCLEMDDDIELTRSLNKTVSSNLGWAWHSLTLDELEWPLFAPEDDNTEMVFLPQFLDDMDWFS